MLGIKNKINDSSLYLLQGLIETRVINAKKELESVDPKEKEKIDFLSKQIAYYESELASFESDIKSQLNNTFQFSVEELYFMYGQYEKYISIEFHKFSESAKQFGESVSGIIVYHKGEREQLDKAISEENVPRTNSSVKIDCSNDRDLPEEMKNSLINTGFLSGDIYQILATNLPASNNYNKPGIKEIPNTIDIEFDPNDFDPYRANLWILSERLKNKGVLIDVEWLRFCGLSLYFEKGSEKFNLIKLKGFDGHGNKKEEVRFFELQAKFYSAEFTKEELLEFNKLLKNREFKRTAAIKKEVKSSTNISLDKIRSEYPTVYEGLQKSIVEFEDASLVYHNIHTPIYWDYESYLHIYLRHCEELGIEGHFEKKTKFQYTQDDIRRILEIAIEKLLPRIEKRLKEGKDFRIYGDRTLYFNGNYYALHILKNGRVASFSPMHNPED